MSADLKARGVPELLPCPFCGEAAHVYTSQHYIFLNSIGCSNENCEMQPSTDYLPEPMAIAAWNQRAALSDHPTVKQMVAEAEARALEGLLTDSTVQFAMGQRICCDGRECGCMGADVGSYIQHLADGYRAEAAAVRKETT